MKTEDGLKNEDNLRNEDDLRNGDDHSLRKSKKTMTTSKMKMTRQPMTGNDVYQTV